jgi:hypothetical protein
MNALQIIPPKPSTRARRSALPLRVSDGFLLLPLLFLLALLAGMSMSRGEEGTASEPGAAVVLKDSQDKVGDNDKSPSVARPAVSAGAATQASDGDDEKMSASSQSAAPTATPVPASVRNDPKTGSDAAEPAAAEAKSDTATRAEIKDPNAHDRDGSGTLAKPSATASAPAASKNDPASKPEDGRVRKMTSNTIAVRSAETARRANRPRREAAYRSWKAADGVPVWSGPPPIIYGSGAGVRAPYVAAPADAARQAWMSYAMTGTWARVVEAPGAVLNGGKHALYGIIDSLW